MTTRSHTFGRKTALKPHPRPCPLPSAFPTGSLEISDVGRTSHLTIEPLSVISSQGLIDCGPSQLANQFRKAARSKRDRLPWPLKGEKQRADSLFAKQRMPPANQHCLQSVLRAWGGSRPIHLRLRNPGCSSSHGTCAWRSGSASRLRLDNPASLCTDATLSVRRGAFLSLEKGARKINTALRLAWQALSRSVKCKEWPDIRDCSSLLGLAPCEEPAKRSGFWHADRGSGQTRPGGTFSFTLR